MQKEAFGKTGIVRCLSNSPLYRHVGNKPMTATIVKEVDDGIIININGVEEFFKSAPIGPYYSTDHRVFYLTEEEYQEDVEKEKMLADLSRYLHKVNLPIKRVNISFETLKQLHEEIINCTTN